MKPIETTFKRIETKYVVSKEILDKLIQDLKEYLVEDDYPISTISNIYFDTEEFDILQEEHLGDKRKEKVRMRTYLSQPKIDSQVFLEIKTKDQEGVGRKFRLLSTPISILNFMTKGHLDASITDTVVIEKVKKLQHDYKLAIKPRMYIYYDRYSLKEKNTSRATTIIKFVSQLTKIQSIEMKLSVSSREITVANQDKVQEVIQSSLNQFCSEVDMITINSTIAGDNLTIVYEVELKSDTDDFQVASYLTRNIAECDVALTKKAKKRKNLQQKRTAFRCFF